MDVIYTTEKDLKKIAECHRSAFPGSLSSKMGLSYLSKMLKWYLSDEKRFLFHIEQDGKCIGYCGGMVSDGTQATGSASGMIQFSFNEAVKAFAKRPWLLFNKEFLSKSKLIRKNIKSKFKKKKKVTVKKTAAVKREPETGLVVIGISKEHQGKGLGSVLLNEFEKKTKQLNIKKMSLTVRRSNQQAIRSYEKSGWIKGKLEGESLEMIKSI